MYVYKYDIPRIYLLNSICDLINCYSTSVACVKSIERIKIMSTGQYRVVVYIFTEVDSFIVWIRLTKMFYRIL